MLKKPAERVYNYVLGKIKSSEWKPEAKIPSENELADHLGVSRVSVRQAFEQLSALGLIVKKRGSGTYISHIEHAFDIDVKAPIMAIDDQGLMELLKFRRYFEFGNARMFMERCTAKDVVKLQKLLKVMESAQSEEAFIKADIEFHALIANGTRNPIVVLMDKIMAGIFDEYQHVLSRKIGTRIGLQYHQQIFDAIQKGDAELASMLMLRHMDETIEALEKAFRTDDEKISTI